MKNRPIGIFDSGLGGLTVLKAVSALLPNENVIYFGDTAHVPYGSKSKKTVTAYSLEIAKFLTARDIKILVIACNTASAVAADVIRKHFPIPVVDVITPGSRLACETTKTGKIAVIGTEGTIRSGAYTKAVHKIKEGSVVIAKPCPLFVPLVEEGWWDEKITELTARKYLDEVKKSGADTLILGCTHYPVLKPVLNRVMGGSVTLVDSAESTARAVRDILHKKNLLRDRPNAKTAVYASDDPERFARLAANILGKPLKKVYLKKLIS